MTDQKACVIETLETLGSFNRVLRVHVHVPLPRVLPLGSRTCIRIGDRGCSLLHNHSPVHSRSQVRVLLQSTLATSTSRLLATALAILERSCFSWSYASGDDAALNVPSGKEAKRSFRVAQPM